MVHRTKISKCSERLVNRLKNTGGGMQLKNYSLAGESVRACELHFPASAEKDFQEAINNSSNNITQIFF